MRRIAARERTVCSNWRAPSDLVCSAATAARRASKLFVSSSVLRSLRHSMTAMTIKMQQAATTAPFIVLLFVVFGPTVLRDLHVGLDGASQVVRTVVDATGDVQVEELVTARERIARAVRNAHDEIAGIVGVRQHAKGVAAWLVVVHRDAKAREAR